MNTAPSAAATQPQVTDAYGRPIDPAKMREALALRRSLTIETSVKFMEGHMYHSPPVFLPGLDEHYRLVE